MSIILYSIFFTIWFFYRYKKDGFSPLVFILGLYGVASILAIPLLYNYGLYSSDPITIYSVLYHILILYLFFSPLSNISKISFSSTKQVPDKFYYYISLFLIITSIPSMLYTMKDLSALISGYGGNLGEVRAAVYSEDIVYQGSGIDFIITVFSSMSYFAVLPFFYYYSKGTNKKIQILLFISSMNIIIQNMRGMSRDGFIIWLFAVVFGYTFFRNEISEERKKGFKKVFGVFAGIAISVFLLITIQRAGLNEVDPVERLLDYFAQPFIYFSYNYDAFFEPNFYGKAVFAFLYDSAERIGGNNINLILNANFYLNTFATFVGSFYRDLGLVLTFIIALSFYIIFKVIWNKKRKFTFVDANIFFLFYMAYTIGLFYWYYSNYMMKGAIAYIIMVALVLFLIRNKILK